MTHDICPHCGFQYTIKVNDYSKQDAIEIGAMFFTGSSYKSRNIAQALAPEPDVTIVCADCKKSWNPTELCETIKAIYIETKVQIDLLTPNGRSAIRYWPKVVKFKEAAEIEAAKTSVSFDASGVPGRDKADNQKTLGCLGLLVSIIALGILALASVTAPIIGVILLVLLAISLYLICKGADSENEYKKTPEYQAILLKAQTEHQKNIQQKQKTYNNSMRRFKSISRSKSLKERG